MPLGWKTHVPWDDICVLAGRFLAGRHMRLGYKTYVLAVWLERISQAGCLIGTIGLFMAAIAAVCAACGTCQNKKSAEATTEMTNVATAMPVAQA